MLTRPAGSRSRISVQASERGRLVLAAVHPDHDAGEVRATLPPSVAARAPLEPWEGDAG